MLKCWQQIMCLIFQEVMLYRNPIISAQSIKIHNSIPKLYAIPRAKTSIRSKTMMSLYT